MWATPTKSKMPAAEAVKTSDPGSRRPAGVVAIVVDDRWVDNRGQRRSGLEEYSQATYSTR
eukprot:15480582-Alexandrium_andersonii.AAC.1